MISVPVVAWMHDPPMKCISYVDMIFMVCVAASVLGVENQGSKCNGNHGATTKRTKGRAFLQ
jgi:hypothetical protein